MTNKCEYCEKTYSSKGALNKHQKTAKYCIKIQNELKDPGSPEIEFNLFHCEYCNKNLTSKIRLKTHQESCIKMFHHLIFEKDLIIKQKDLEIEQEIIDKKTILNLYNLDNQTLKDRIIELETENRVLREHSKENQSTINEIAKQPRIATTNNHNKILINTPVDLSQPTVQHAIQNGFSDEYLVQGQKGVARFAVDNMLKDKDGKLIYICTDPSRQIFQYKNDQGKIEKDVRATRLTQALLEADIKQTSHKIAWDNMKDGDNEVFMTYTNHYQDIQELEQDNSKFSKELCCLTAK